jgi:hypothetical protein
MERLATAVSLTLVAVVMLLAAIHRETPYRVIAKPLEGRIHIGKDEDASAPASPASQRRGAPVQGSAAAREAH